MVFQKYKCIIMVNITGQSSITIKIQFGDVLEHC